MIKNYRWYLVYLVFVGLSLTNIFQKLTWNSPTDRIEWEQTPDGLVCVSAPEDSSIKKGDLLFNINKFIITDKVDLARAISARRFSIYDIERKGFKKYVGVEIFTRYTPFYYYILSFSGILFILLSLRVLNTTWKKRRAFEPPPVFYLLSLSFSGFLIFSPTGDYNSLDFLFLALDRLSYLFFPAFMLHYSLYFPIRLKIVRMINPRLIRWIIYIPVIQFLVLSSFFTLSQLLTNNPVQELIGITLNHFRTLSFHFFAFYLLLNLISFLSSNLWLIFRRKQNRFWVPLTGVTISIPAMLISNYVSGESGVDFSYGRTLIPFLMVFLPLSLTYYLGHRKFTDIENIIKKTVAVASIFVFIFGIFFFLGSTIEQNKLIGIFWSIAAILTAGLLYKPIEGTIHQYFERLFFRSAADFKRKLQTLIQAFRNERNLPTIASNFLSTINEGFQLQKSAFIVHDRKSLFYSLPKKEKLIFSRNFHNELFLNDSLVFFSITDFQKRFPRDYQVMKEMNYFQFLPLKTQDRLIGFIAFGSKNDGTYLSEEDWEIMSSIASPLTLSVENASLYSELESQFNEISLLKEFNENIIENVNIGIVVLTRLNIIKTWNQFMENKFNIPRERAVGAKAHSIFHLELWKQIFMKKTGVASIHNIKVEINNNELTFDLYISPLRDTQGKVLGTILVFEDVTEKLFIQGQLVTSEKMASLGLLSAGIAHEVNTPLTGISSFCQFILDNPQDPENVDLVLKIQEQVQRANKIIRTLLDFSRQKGEVPMELDLNKIVNESISLVEHTLRKKNIHIHRDFDFKTHIHGFSTRLQQMLINLLLNANDAIIADEGQISIFGEEDQSALILRIKDNGSGIESRYFKKIFDPFFTTKEKGKGTGLGLSITYNIVQEHYGEITVNSKVGKGTTFIIRLPIESPLRSIKL